MALVAFASGHGVKVETPTVLSDTSNLVVQLAPAPIVARIPNVTAAGRDRPEVSLGRELAICSHLDRLGIPTTRPSAELPPGPHRLADRWVSFVEFTELEPVDDDAAGQAGERLADVIGALATLEDEGGLFDRSLRDEAEVVLARLDGRLASDDHRLLVEWAAEAFVANQGDSQPVHADPHRKNVGRRSDGEVVWFDFDDAVHDSPFVDLATLQRSWPEAGAAACARLGVDPGGPELARYIEQREAWGGIWAQMFVLELGEEYRAGAAAALDGRRQ